ncbi:uncharacterized protein LOC119914941 [Micropterus salmoides]|uniref:uncharacterized protein LOC119914941 n=1 Tax=Micropterus salmoides TaxID=27706 RepID=UPI0018EB06D5|nr:uncharacterized protein LOC119914941 [Micropterus salmoides]
MGSQLRASDRKSDGTNRPSDVVTVSRRQTWSCMLTPTVSGSRKQQRRRQDSRSQVRSSSRQVVTERLQLCSGESAAGNSAETSTLRNLKRVFQVFPEKRTFLELLVGGAAVLFGILRKRRRGKRAGALVKLRQRGFHTALPSIHLANVRSLDNKMDELLLLNRTNLDFCRSAALCFTSWTAHFTYRDREREHTGKTRGGGLCFYINEGWCTDVTVLKKSCRPHLETLFINCMVSHHHA